MLQKELNLLPAFNEVMEPKSISGILIPKSTFVRCKLESFSKQLVHNETHEKSSRREELDLEEHPLMSEGGYCTRSHMYKFGVNTSDLKMLDSSEPAAKS